jgi:histidyl-tRNA synthetase
MTSPNTTAIRRSRGMRDLLPGDMRAFRRVEDAFRAAASRWGYDEVRTPTIETYSLFTAAGALTPQMLSRVYSFLDWDGWSGERVVLRPDSTIPVARAASEAGLDLPARLFYVQNVFRFSESDDREDWQCGLEYLAAPPSLGDLEVAAVACETLEALGLRPRVRIGHVGVARAVTAALVASGNGDLRSLLDQVAVEGLAPLRGLVAANAPVAAFIEVATQEGGPGLLGNLAGLASAALPNALPAIEEATAVAEALAESGRDVVVDLGMPRDFEYYTGVVFELDAAGEPWGRGGRYAPVGEGAGATACGLALETGRLAAHVAPGTRRRLTVSVHPEGAHDLARAMAVARALHRSGIAASLSGASDPSGLSVRVSGESLVALTPDGETRMSALDDVVGLLVRYK